MVTGSMKLRVATNRPRVSDHQSERSKMERHGRSRTVTRSPNTPRESTTSTMRSYSGLNHHISTIGSHSTTGASAAKAMPRGSTVAAHAV